MKGMLLVVDDDSAVADVLSRLLGARGWSVLAVRGAEEALRLSAAEEFRAVLLDNELPGLSGLQALPELSRRRPVVMMSGLDDEETRKDAALLGASAFLGKPIDVGELDRALEAAGL